MSSDQHSSPIKTPRQLITVVVLAFVVPVILIVLLVTFVTGEKVSGAGTESMTPEAVAERLRPVGTVVSADVAAGPKTLQTGEAVYKLACNACHATGVAGAPKTADAGAWARRASSRVTTRWSSTRSTGSRKPLQSLAAEIRPMEMRTQLTHLSNLIGYKVLDANGEQLGIASDYIINTCETYIIYFLMEPAASLNMAPETRVVIPFEAVTINSGVLDAQNEAIQQRLLPEQFSGAPAFPAGQQLTPTDWEKAVKAFWAKMVRIGSLATSCNVAGGPVYKVAYATQLLGIELYDGRNDLLGTVQDAILEPESGKLALFMVKPAEGDGYVLVHLRATNIPKEAFLPGAALSLVLTSDPQVFWEAPHISSLDEADDIELQNKMRQYWDR